MFSLFESVKWLLQNCLWAFSPYLLAGCGLFQSAFVRTSDKFSFLKIK
jgi:hypothetical protein